MEISPLWCHNGARLWGGTSTRAGLSFVLVQILEKFQQCILFHSCSSFKKMCVLKHFRIWALYDITRSASPFPRQDTSSQVSAQRWSTSSAAIFTILSKKYPCWCHKGYRPFSTVGDPHPARCTLVEWPAKPHFLWEAANRELNSLISGDPLRFLFCWLKSLTATPKSKSNKQLPKPGGAHWAVSVYRIDPDTEMQHETEKRKWAARPEVSGDGDGRKKL